MKTIKQKLFYGLILSVFTLLNSVNAYAEEGAIRFSNNAFKQVISKTADGSVQYDYVDPALVLPKDVILYEIVFENVSDKTVSNIVINNPIANNSNYRDGSVTGESTNVTFTVDGKRFAAADSLVVTDKSGKKWKAKPEQYTAIRWVYTKALNPGEKKKVTYKTSIK